MRETKKNLNSRIGGEKQKIDEKLKENFSRTFPVKQHISTNQSMILKTHDSFNIKNKLEHLRYKRRFFQILK